MLSRDGLRRLRLQWLINGYPGFELIAYCVTIYTLSTKPQRGHSDPFYIVFSTLLLVLMTMLYSTNAIFGEEMYIVNAGHSGGMDAYLAAYVNVWYQTLGSSAPIAANLLGDALMVGACQRRSLRKH